VSVVPTGVTGFALAGIAAMLDGLDSVRVLTSPLEGYRLLCSDERAGQALSDEVAAMVEAAASVPTFLANLRRSLQLRGGNIGLGAAARELSLSTRSLQRQLGDSGTSFRAEVLAARYRAACELLASSEEKMTGIAARLGITETALTRLMRARSGKTPAEYRRRTWSAE
jgi:AraC-like DNA-binding protein